MSDRYFIVWFSGMGEGDILRTGKIEYRTIDGKYANEKSIIEKAEESFGLEQIFVKDIQELSESEYKDWIEGSDEESPSAPDEDVGFL